MSDEFLKEVMEKWDHANNAEAHNRDDQLQDLRFGGGDQWPEHIRRIREADGGGRPCLTINKYPAFERQIMNDIRMMRPGIKIRAHKGGANKDTANILNGMIRAIEGQCNAESAYDWAAMYAIRMGRGYFRIVTDYEDNESFDQIIKIERIRNPFSVYLDPDHKEHDASDAMWAFETFRISRDEFEERWPDAEGEWPGEQIGEGMERWFEDDSVRVAKFYVIDIEEREISLIQHPLTMEEIIVDGKVDGAIQTRTVEDRLVKCYTLTPMDILEEDVIPGKYIPIVPVTGEEVDIEGRIYYKGLVRDIKDSQIEINLMRSTSVEQIALQPKSPWIGPKGSFSSTPNKWNNANRANYAYLEYDIVQPGLKPERQLPPPVQPALQEEIRIATEELKEITGIYQAALGARSNEVAGVAIKGRKIESDVSNFHYSDNLARSMKQAGRVIINMIPDVYPGPRIVSILQPDGAEKQVVVNQPSVDPETQKEYNYDLSLGTYDVTVDTSPSYTTQRQEAADAQMDLLKAFPQAAELIGDLVVNNMDWPQSEQIAERLRTMLPPEILQGESPAINQMVQQIQQESEAKVQQMMQLNQMYEEQIKVLYQQLQDKQVEQAQKQQELDRKAVESEMKSTIDVAELELKYNQDLPGGLVGG